MPLWFRGLYSLLWLFALPFAFARLWWRGRVDDRYRNHWAQRIGNADFGREIDVWIHAVSVGEARATVPLVKQLLSLNKRILFTCMTPTGRDALKSLFLEAGSDQVVVRYLPFDAPFLMRRFLLAARPRLGILMETELWPGLCDAAQRASLPLWMVNARLSERSAAGYLRGGTLTRAMLSCLTGIAAQTDAHAARFRALGASNVHVVGNLKFDIQISAHFQQRADALTEHIMGRAPTSPFWVAGVTRDGEEVMLLTALQRHSLRSNAQAVIVPRHLERCTRIVEQARALGFRVARRSDGVIAAGTEVIIGDSMGEMLSYYANAKVVVMGGTLGKTGGQNLIEPCAVGVPVILGPSTYNFQQAADEAVAAGAAIRATDAREALTQVLEWIGNEPARKYASTRAQQFVAKHRGATERTLALLRVND
jgi:3-deoxy-D-manno-octulosonic-acid transferase